LTRISTRPRLQTCIGRRDCVGCACVSCPHGPAIWLSASPPGTNSAVFLYVLSSCRCGRHADTLGLVDDRKKSFFHIHGEIHRWSLASTKHSQECKNKRGLPDHLWVLQRALEGRSGRTERSKSARGRITQQRPESRGALNKPTEKHGLVRMSSPLGDYKFGMTRLPGHSPDGLADEARTRSLTAYWISERIVHRPDCAKVRKQALE